MPIDNDHETTQALHTLFREAEVPPSRADIGAAVRQGRRAARRRRGAAATVSVLAVFGMIGTATVVLDRGEGVRLETARPAPSVSPGPVGTVTAQVQTVQGGIDDSTLRCVVAPLAPPGEASHVHATGVDPSGRFIVGGIPAPDEQTPRFVDPEPEGTATPSPSVGGQQVLWDRGKPKVFTVPKSFYDTPLVNAAGLVAGTGSDNQSAGRGPEFGWVYRDGQVHRLPLLPGYDSARLVEITEQGDVVGYAYRLPPEGEPIGAAVPVLWRSDGTGGPWPLSTPENGGRVLGVTRDGAVVGQHGDSHLRIWRPDGSAAELRLPPGITRMSGGHVSGDWVVGFVASSDAQSPTPLMRWNVRTGQLYVYPDIDTGDTLSMAVNAGGWVIVTTPKDHQLVVTPDDTVRRLPTPPGAEEWAEKVIATAISDNGLVVGSVYRGPDEPTHNHTWQCGG